MRKTVLCFFFTLLSAGVLVAQTDTMYIMKDGLVIGTYSTADIDSIVFYTPPEKGPEISDFDGNVYQSVYIGDQLWMAENLRTTHYADGSPVPAVESMEDWNALPSSEKAYCWYSNDSTKNAGTYGALYNWAAAVNGTTGSSEALSKIQGICPNGWHLPANEEWNTLQSYLITNGYNYDGSKTANKIGVSLTAPGLWNFSSREGSVGNTMHPLKRNQTGFSAVPSGFRDSFGGFNYKGEEAHFWSSTEYNELSSWISTLASWAIAMINDLPLCYYKKNAFSVRCIKD